MFDVRSHATHQDLLDQTRCFFAEHGHQLASVAGMLGGAAGEAKAVSCALRLDECERIDRRLKRDLEAVHRLLTLHGHFDPTAPNSDFVPTLDPGSREVETICLLTDLLQDLLCRIEDTTGYPSRKSRLAAA